MSDPIYVAGIDEAGRGPLAGPVTAACVVLFPDYSNTKIRDSKKLSANARESLFEEIKSSSLGYSVVSVGPRRIEELNIREATRLAMSLAASRVNAALLRDAQEVGKRCALHLLIDGNTPIATNMSQETIIKGDSKMLVIAAASILAKVTRDRLMERLDMRYPGYGFAKHKGYPTKFHLEKIVVNKPVQPHRRTFAGVREHLLCHLGEKK